MTYTTLISALLAIPVLCSVLVAASSKIHSLWRSLTGLGNDCAVWHGWPVLPWCAAESRICPRDGAGPFLSLECFHGLHFLHRFVCVSSAGRTLPIKYFPETSTLLVALATVDRLLSAFARQKAIDSISIRSLQPATALLADTDGLVITEIDA